MIELDADYVRAQFPAFQEASLRGQSFFENAGGSFACRYVIWRLHRFYKERKVQPYAPYKAAEIAGAEMDDSKRRMALILGASPEEVSFGPSTTQNVYVLSQAFREILAPGDAIVVTNQDHEANSGAWRRLSRYGIEVREWQIDAETGHLDPDALTTLLDDGKVRLVCFPHCSNVIAEINDVASIAALVRRMGAWSCVDGVSYAPHGIPNVNRLGVDIYMFSSYKTYGPHQGILYVREALADRLPNQGHWFNADTPSLRFAPAGPDHAQVAACAGIADYIDALYHHHVKAGRDATGRAAEVHDMMRRRERRLMRPLLNWVSSRPELRLLGPKDIRSRAPTFAFALDRPAEAVARRLGDFGILAAGGDFYAPRPLDALGIDPDLGVLRVSFVHYTSEDDVARLIDALEEVL